ncbi:hypothetical protein Glove_362g57 [Diversispora epigaea]|uniref:Protein kinase domain-containing protein n=1 Tax=Diversispora epigaea TaxID=1348612 RepID=A0A397HGS0_9GLOM|nr:hypothetical protein Glove_362g57 [Diversispora epigaea]
MATQKIEWKERLTSVWNKITFSLDINIHRTVTEQNDHIENMIKNELSLTEKEKKFLVDELQNIFDALRIGDNSVEKRQCNNCQEWHQAIQYCEFCIRKYLENNFGNWTSRNDEIDKLIKECQQKTLAPHKVIEWIEYDQFGNVEHLTEGGCSSIYTATWKDGHYKKWDSERQILERFGRQDVVLKRLYNSNNNVNWFQEVTLSFTLDYTSAFIAEFYGLTKDPITQDYMLVLNHYQSDLRHFIKKDDYHSFTLLQKYRIINCTAISLTTIHQQNILHRDLHSGNILYNAKLFIWEISDLGLSGPVDKPSDSIYGNLPYIAPEVICGEVYTTKSDIYSMGILMWEVITGETPFDDYDYEHDSELAIDIVKGCRPKIYKCIPREYATLMEQCWDANPDNRPDAYTICKKMGSLLKPLYNEMDEQQKLIMRSKSLKSKIKNFFKLKLRSKKGKNKNQVIMNTQISKNTKSRVYKIQNSKVYAFKIPIQPRNATDAFDSGQFDFEISEQSDLEVSEEMQQQYLKSVGANNAFDSGQFDFEISEQSDLEVSEEMQQQYLKSVGANNDDQE